jgi:hypothetical protein
VSKSQVKPVLSSRPVQGGELLDWQKEYNAEVNKIRWMIEQVISHFKNWTIMHTDTAAVVRDRGIVAAGQMGGRVGAAAAVMMGLWNTINTRQSLLPR